jgi:hypothetical protein
MGKNNKRRGGNNDWEEIVGDDDREGGQIEHNDTNGFRGGTDNENGVDISHSDRYNSGNSEYQGISEAQTEVDFDPYLKVVEELKVQLPASQKALKNGQRFYTKQERAIKEVIWTKQQLEEMIVENRRLTTTIDTLESRKKRKDEEYTLKIASLKNESENLEMAKELAKKDQRKLEEEKDDFNKKMRAVEAEHEVKLDKRRTELEKEHNEKYRKREETLEREMQECRDEDKRKITNLEAEMKKLSEELDEQRSKLIRIEGKCKDAEVLKKVYEGKAAELEEKLKKTENEFGLNSESTEY